MGSEPAGFGSGDGSIALCGAAVSHARATIQITTSQGLHVKTGAILAKKRNSFPLRIVDRISRAYRQRAQRRRTDCAQRRTRGGTMRGLNPLTGRAIGNHGLGQRA